MSASVPRRATTADLPSVLELLGQEWPEENNASRWGEYLQEQEESGDAHAEYGVWVLDEGGTVAAVAAAKFLRRTRYKQAAGRAWPVYLMYLATRPDLRGAGHGARLEEFVLRELARHGYPGAYLLVDPDKPGGDGALRFWERQGWKRADAADSPPTRVLMTKQAAAPRPPAAPGSS
ncbi:GNAT family N-acetyltransferase [Streptomyces europaeiscabiei]|uniref:GNAT family N-acetyltransferase n=1 Tax=Streptomyces europaeiscabiei TaxID=146819 RepID=UPI0038F5EEBF